MKVAAALVALLALRGVVCAPVDGDNSDGLDDGLGAGQRFDFPTTGPGSDLGSGLESSGPQSTVEKTVEIVKSSEVLPKILGAGSASKTKTTVVEKTSSRQLNPFGGSSFNPELETSKTIIERSSRNGRNGGFIVDSISGRPSRTVVERTSSGFGNGLNGGPDGSFRGDVERDRIYWFGRDNRLRGFPVLGLAEALACFPDCSLLNSNLNQ